MIGTQRSWPTDIVSGVVIRKPERTANVLAGSLQMRRNAVASTEPEDAQITGMTRSLDRRLLALNLKPVGSAALQTLRVA